VVVVISEAGIAAAAAESESGGPAAYFERLCSWLLTDVDQIRLLWRPVGGRCGACLFNGTTSTSLFLIFFTEQKILLCWLFV
jgi:hypothetical protein